MGFRRRDRTVAKWIRKNWDVVVIASIAVAVSVVFFYLVLRPMPVPPGY